MAERIASRLAVHRLYTLAVYVLTPLVLSRLAWRSIRVPAYLHRWKERFGWFKAPLAQAPIWVHAVSVGEVNAAVPLVKSLRARYAGVPIVVTTITPTGSHQVRHIFGSDVFHVYAPYDLPGAVNRFLTRVRPRMAVVMETELWPNIFHGCRDQGVPIMVANARLSERSARGYWPMRRLLASTLRCVDAIAAQTRTDADRMIALGADPASVQVTGSVKFDVGMPSSLQERGEAIRHAWGSARPVWAAASTHEGEDEAVLDAFARVRETLPDALLVLAPRHPDRFHRVVGLCRRRGYRTLRRSVDGLGDSTADCFVIDSMGELPMFLAAVDVAFVGGTLVPAGGHNVLEPAGLGKPVLVGPHTFNVAEIAQMLIDRGGGRRVSDAGELGAHLAELLADADRRDRMGTAGRDLVQAKRGALERMSAMIDDCLAGSSAGPPGTEIASVRHGP